MVSVPFVLLRPFTRRDQNDELGEPGRQDAVEPQIVAQRPYPVHEFRASKEDRPWAAEVASRSREVRGRLFLGLGHLVGWNRRHPLLSGCRRPDGEGQNTGQQDDSGFRASIVMVDHVRLPALAKVEVTQRT